VRLLLLSNSRNPGQGYLEHVREEIRDFLGEVDQLVFVPYAGVQNPGQYVAGVRQAFQLLGTRIQSVTEVSDPVAAIYAARAIAVGGGNTFQLLRRMYQTGLLAAVRERVRAGVPYIGWSAGSNLACPTICTTNDMPVVQPPSFAALGLVPFQINPHYTERVLADHGGESRDERIAEFLVLNPGDRVVGLREGSWLRVEGPEIVLGGSHPMRLFRAGASPEDVAPGRIVL
jgi:dipeptidase E